MSDWTGVVVADDLTGAMDTGNAFAARGHRVVVPVGDGRPSPGGVVVVDTDSRYSPPGAAADRVTAAVDRWDAPRYYKKVDSTLRGNLAAEVEAALAATGAPLGVVAPAFPENGRTTACGYHLIDGRLVTDTPAGDDPDRPVASPRIGDLFDGAEAPTEHVGVGTVARGEAAVHDALVARVERHAAPVLVTCDATHESHLAGIASGAATLDLDGEPLYVGSGGLAAHVPLGSPAAGPVTVTAAGERVLGIVGSTHPTTLDALGEVPAERVVGLDVARAVTAPEAAADRAAVAVGERLEVEPAVVLVSARGQADVRTALTVADELGVDHETARDRIAAALAGTAARLYGGTGGEPAPDGLFFTGGAVAGAVLEALDATAVELSGTAVTTGVPVGLVAGGAADGTPVVTKAGGFGTSTTVMACLAHLGNDA